MSDRIDFGGEPWQAIPRRVLRDARLSARAKGGLVTLLSHEEGWVRSCIAVLQNECAIGRNQAKAIMAELRELGYAEMSLERREDSNLVQTRYVVSAVPTSTGSQPDLFSSQVDRQPDAPNPGRTESSAAVVEALDVEPLDEEPQGSTTGAGKPSRAPDPIWDALVECYGLVAHDAERGRRNKAVGLLRQAEADIVEIVLVHQSAVTHRDEYVRRMAATPIAFATNWSDIRRVLAEVDPDSFEARLARGNKMLGVADG